MADAEPNYIIDAPGMMRCGGPGRDGDYHLIAVHTDGGVYLSSDDWNRMELLIRKIVNEAVEGLRHG